MTRRRHLFAVGLFGCVALLVNSAAAQPGEPAPPGPAKPGRQAQDPDKPDPDKPDPDKPKPAAAKKAKVNGDKKEQDGDDSSPWDWLEYVRPGLDVIGQYNLRLRDGTYGTEWYHEFEIPRLFGTITANYKDAEARLVVESVRSASEGSLIGVAGDSLVIRLREAYAGYTLFERLNIRLGLLPTLTIPALQSSWALRAVEAVGSQRVTYASPADLGATAKVKLPLKMGWMGVGAYNGEGYNRRELNRGKNVELAAQFHPIFPVEDARPFSVFFSYLAGSSGTGLARQNRITGALMWSDERIGGGASVVYAQGFQDRGDIDGVLMEVWARGEPYENILLAGQFAHWWRNIDAPDPDTIITVTASAGYRIVKPLEAMVAFDAFVPSDLASAALPELDAYRVRAITRVRFDEGGFK